MAGGRHHEVEGAVHRVLGVVGDDPTLAAPPDGRRRDRRFICTRCAMKWFIPASRPELEDLTECSSCHGDVLPLVTDRAPSAAATTAVDRCAGI